MKTGHGAQLITKEYKVTLKKSIPSALIFTISKKKPMEKTHFIYESYTLIINLKMCVGVCGCVFPTKGERCKKLGCSWKENL